MDHHKLITCTILLLITPTITTHLQPLELGVKNELYPILHKI